jgi:pimeloyl-ACP methyl ester carboxylesterase
MRLSLPGFTMAYDDRGRGLPLLFIHGYPLNRTLWEPQIDDLSYTTRVLTVDLRGHGESDPMPGPYPMDMLADDCISLLDALGITRPIVICGLSMGGYVTFAFYRRYAAHVAGLILTATRAGADSSESKANRDKSAVLAQEKGADVIAEAMLPRLLSPKTLTARPDLVDRVRKIMRGISVDGIIGDLTGMRDRLDSTPLLTQINIPTLIINGADDQIIPLSEVKFMHQAIINSELKIIPDAGHLPNLEQPELFNQVVKEFTKFIK